MREVKSKLIGAGWTCLPCACTGSKGYDCGNKEKRGYIIKLKATTFKLIHKGHIIESGHLYQLDEKLKKHGLL